MSITSQNKASQVLLSLEHNTTTCRSQWRHLQSNRPDGTFPLSKLQLQPQAAAQAAVAYNCAGWNRYNLGKRTRRTEFYLTWSHWGKGSSYFAFAATEVAAQWGSLNFPVPPRTEALQDGGVYETMGQGFQPWSHFSSCTIPVYEPAGTTKQWRAVASVCEQLRRSSPAWDFMMGLAAG